MNSNNQKQNLKLPELVKCESETCSKMIKKNTKYKKCYDCFMKGRVPCKNVSYCKQWIQPPYEYCYTCN